VEPNEGRHEMARIAREAPEGSARMPTLPNWMANHLDNALHAYDANAGRIICPVGEHDLAYEFVEGEWENSASPNKCPACAEALRAR